MSSAFECCYRWHGDTLTLFCHLQPGARNSSFSGRYGDRLKIRIAAPPVEGKANRALIEFLAAEFGVAKSAVSIERGELGRQKTVTLQAPTRLPGQLGIVSNAVASPPAVL